MNFEFSDEQQLLREQARGFLTEHCPTSAVRAVLDGDHDWDAMLWQKVADMGWTRVCTAYCSVAFEREADS